jgi:hypothetical protein
MYRDLNWWGIVIGLTALACSLPLTILGNILTPRLLNWWASSSLKMRNWWANRSLKSLIGSIAKLKQTLSEMEELPPLTETEEAILASNELNRKMIWGFGSFGLVSVLLFVLSTVSSRPSVPMPLLIRPGEFITVSGQTFRRIFLIFIAFAMTANYFIYALETWDLTNFRRQRSPYERERIRIQIAVLEGKLTIRNNAHGASNKNVIR